MSRYDGVVVQAEWRLEGRRLSASEQISIGHQITEHFVLIVLVTRCITLGTTMTALITMLFLVEAPGVVHYVLGRW